MAPEFSTYTVVQASGRAWRIGQHEPCRTYFFCYGATLQAEALRLVATKIACAVRVNGDVVGEDSLAELDEQAAGDILTTLARLVAEQESGEGLSLTEAFAQANAEFQAQQGFIGGYTLEAPARAEETVLDLVARPVAHAPAMPAGEGPPGPPAPISPLLRVLEDLTEAQPATARPRGRGPSLLEALRAEQAKRAS